MTDRVRASMGYQPSLDGLRAVAVIGVILYHAGFGWMHGGFLGVEVFFVVSGFLITTLLIEERERAGRVHLGNFWMRRWRRLLPALFTMLVAVSLWAALWGSTEQHSQMRRDLPWSIFYLANWGQISGDVPYFASSAPLLRHLWSLAVEEQWYVIWPLVFVGLATVFARRRSSPAPLLVTVAGVVMVGTAVAAVVGEFDSKVNFLYLSTLTRCSGLLLGAAAAFVWRPWRRSHGVTGDPLPRLDLVGSVAIGVVGASFVLGRVTDRTTYVLTLPAVSVASLVVVLVAVHPRSAVWRQALSWRPLVEVGKRSYGLYLWSWPISRICGADGGSGWRFVLAMIVTIPVNELSYRVVEVPVRRGALGRWWATTPAPQRSRTVLASSVVAAVVLLPLGQFYRTRAATFDLAVDETNDLSVDLDAILGPDGADPGAAAGGADPPNGSVAGQRAADFVDTTTTTTAPVSRKARRVVIVGDSQAHSFFVNLPKGLGSKFKFSHGAQSGCSVYDSGVGVSSNGSTRRFVTCKGWDKAWAAAARKNRAQLAVVMIGAWDVMDVRTPDGVIRFGTKQFDSRFVDGLRQGVSALTGAGAKVVLLEIACMRPVEAKGVPLIPERGDDERVARLNRLMRDVAESDPEHVTFMPGPKEWCANPAISKSVGYRWDGVHLYKPGAKLLIQTIAKPLLAVPLS